MGTSNTTALVMGEALVDVVEKNGESRTFAGGSPFNVAIGLANLGIKTVFGTGIADDANGRLIRDALAASGVRTIVADGVLRTPIARASIAADGSADYAFELENAMPRYSGDPVGLAHVGSIATYLEPGATTILETLDGLPSDTLVSYDPNIRPNILDREPDARERIEQALARADVIKMSDEDASWLWPGEDLDEVLDELLENSPGQPRTLVAITRGAEGSVLATLGARVEVPAERASVVDTVGAGDSFMAGMLRAILVTDRRSVSAAEWLRIVGSAGARNSAFTVERQGAVLPTLADLRA